jgi:uncharacterized protein YcbX
MKILQLWRYPVKSMQGESLSHANVGPKGVGGDRQRAIVDADSGVSLSAKRYGELLYCHAGTVGDQVVIRMPDSSEHPADSADAAEALSELLRRRVAIQRARSDHTVRHEFPTELADGEGEPFLWEPGLDGFFDRAPLHLITTSTLLSLSHASPQSDFDRARFRPNILVENDDAGFVENDWVGHDLRLGSLTCNVLDRKPRCVMTTRPQGQLDADREVIKTIIDMNEGTAGIELRAAGDGVLRIGDSVNLLS